MNKDELVREVSAETGFTLKDSKLAVDSIATVIKNTLINGESVMLVGFGKWTVRDRAARNGVNPKTGEKIKIAASKVPVFKAGKEFKNLIKV